MTATTDLLRDRDFQRITLADFIVRAAYQMGKTPLLPLYAAALGASDVLLGFIVSVSTLTGMVSKPLVGFFSDRWGRRNWLFVGTAFFTFVPFLYWLVDTPNQLVALRIFHGSATAIYGPVTVAWVMENTPGRRAESLGWFGIARQGGYIVGPALGGLLLLWWEPAAVFTVIGLASAAAFWPIARLSDPYQPPAAQEHAVWRQLRAAATEVARAPAVWLAGAVESYTYVALYAVRAFLPIYAVQQGYNALEAGLFFSVQEAVHTLFKPFGGRLADRTSYNRAIVGGMFGVGVALAPIAVAPTWGVMLVLAALLGAAQAILFPSTTALVAVQVKRHNLGTSVGWVGTLQNGGKVLGPIVGGVLVGAFDFPIAFTVLAGIMVVGAIVVSILNLNGRQEHVGAAAD